MQSPPNRSDLPFIALIEALPDGVAIADESHKFIAQNSTFARAWGGVSDVGELSLCFDSASREILEQLTGRDDAGDVNGVRQLRSETGEDWEVHVSRATLLETSVRVWTTRRVRPAAYLEPGGAQYGPLVDWIPEGIVEVDNNDVIRFANRRFCTMTGYELDELMGRNARELFLNDDQQEFIDEQIRRRREGKSDRYEIALRRRDGSSLWVEVSGAPIANREGEVVGSVGIQTDITDRKLQEERLGASELRYRILFERNVAGVFRSTIDGRFLDANQAVVAIYGYPSVEELLAINAAQLFPDPASRRKMVEDLRERGFLRNYELTLVRKDGSMIHVLENISLVQESPGAEPVLYGTVIDVTEQKMVLERLRETELRFQLLTRAANDLVYDWDMTSGYLWWSDAVTLRYGYPPEEVRHDIAWWESLIHPEDLPGVMNPLSEAIDSGKSFWAGEYRFRRADGTYGWVLDRGCFVRDSAGQSVRMLGLMLDISGRKAAEEELRRSEEHFRALIEHSTDMTVVLAPDHTIKYVSPSSHTIFGFEPGEAVGCPLSDLVHPADIPEVVSALTSRVQTPEASVATSFRVRHADGSWRNCEVVASNFTHVESVGGVVVHIRDVTDRRILEAELEHVRHLSSLGRLAATMAHEFNNVLMGIQPFAEFIRRLGVEDRAEAAAVRIIQSVDRGKRITSEILRFTRQPELSLRAVDVRTWLRELEEELDVLLAGRGITLEIAFPPDPLFLTADVELLNQVMTNLAINARDAMPQGGTLAVRVEEAFSWMQYNFGALPTPDRFLHVTVRDTGSGIPDAVRAHIFEPLFTTKKAGGTGLGLTIVHQVVTAHEGHVFVESSPGQGTTFHLFLPRAIWLDMPQSADSPPEKASLRAGTRVLIVDDDEAVVSGMSALLEFEGCEVAAVYRGQEAVQAIEVHSPEVVILDLSLPDQSGVDVFHAIFRKWPDLPVLFASGHADKSLLEPLLGGHVRFLSKPYDGEVLLRTLAEIIAK